MPRPQTQRVAPAPPEPPAAASASMDPPRLSPPRLSLMLCTEPACSRLSPDQRAEGTKGWCLGIAFLRRRGQGTGVPPAQARRAPVQGTAIPPPQGTGTPPAQGRTTSSHSGGVEAFLPDCLTRVSGAKSRAKVRTHPSQRTRSCPCAAQA